MFFAGTGLHRSCTVALAALAWVYMVTWALASSDPMRPFSIWPAPAAQIAVPVTAKIYVPELSRALRETAPPDTGAFAVELTTGKKRGSVPHKLLNRLRGLGAYGGETGSIPAIHLTRGTTDLRTLAKQPALARHLGCGDRRCRLSVPLLVAEGASLVIDGLELDLVGETGALIGNHGTLTIRNSTVTASMPPDFAFGEGYREFRPFIVGLEGSDTRLIGSAFFDLGFADSVGYGVSISARGHEREPTGLLVGNVFDGLYYGFYSHHAREIPIVDNLYRDNIVYGIDPHDYSHRLWIIGNRAHGTKKKHGIIISRGVHDSVIAMNRSHDNARAGIMLDRHSSDNAVIYNHTWRNGYDGIAIYESSDNLIAHNSAVENGKTGLRMRNAQNLTVAHNFFAGNLTGIKAYTGRPQGFARRDEDVYTMSIEARLISNTVSGNRREDLSFKGCVRRIVFDDERGNQPGFTTPHVRFGGDRTWKEMLRRVAELTRGDLDIRFDCEALFVDPAAERARRGTQSLTPATGAGLRQ